MAFGCFGFGAKGVEEDVPGVFVDTKEEVDVSADGFLEGAGEVGEEEQLTQGRAFAADRRDSRGRTRDASAPFGLHLRARL